MVWYIILCYHNILYHVPWFITSLLIVFCIILISCQSLYIVSYCHGILCHFFEMSLSCYHDRVRTQTRVLLDIGRLVSNRKLLFHRSVVFHCLLRITLLWDGVSCYVIWVYYITSYSISRHVIIYITLCNLCMLYHCLWRTIWSYYVML